MVSETEGDLKNIPIATEFGFNSPNKFINSKISNITLENKYLSSRVFDEKKNNSRNNKTQSSFIKTGNTFNVSDKAHKKDKNYRTLSNLNKHFTNSIKNIQEKKSIERNHPNKINITEEGNNKSSFFCPFCEHCNKLEDPHLTTYLNSIKDSKSILSKGFEYIIQSNILKNSGLNLFRNSEGGNDLVIDGFLNKMPQHFISNRLTYSSIGYFLNALLDEKLFFQDIVPIDLSSKIQNALMARGSMFNETVESFNFDPEVYDLIDEKTKKTVEQLFKSKRSIYHRKTFASIFKF